MNPGLPGTVAAPPTGFGATLLSVAPVLDPRLVLTGPVDVERPADGTTAPDGTWLRCADLCTPVGLAAAVAHVQAHNADAGAGTDVPHNASTEVAVSYLIAWYAANIVGPAIAAFVLARRVPDLDPTGISVRRREGGWFDATAFHSARMVVLATDPAATHSADTDPAGTDPASTDPAGCGPYSAERARTTGGDPIEVIEVVPDVEVLLGRLVNQIVAHLEPVVTELRSHARLGLPALWGAVAAQCGRAFLLTERISGDPHAGRTEADAFFARACPPLRARPTWQQFVHHGQSYTGMRRGSCCLAHRLTEEFCTACPFVSAADREARLKEWIDAQGPGSLAL